MPPLQQTLALFGVTVAAGWTNLLKTHAKPSFTSMRVIDARRARVTAMAVRTGDAVLPVSIMCESFRRHEQPLSVRIPKCGFRMTRCTIVLVGREFRASDWN